jgi:two-component system, cell cycle sensor histidine kinase and response regulator CckA
MAIKEAKGADWRSPERKHSEVQLRAQLLARRRVLVVDDEPLIRLFVARALRASGYDVIEADSAERAMELLATEGNSLSLLLSDVGLPGASGPELVEHARGSLPSLATQLMSATSKHWLVSERVLKSDVDLLQKPFKVADLLNRVDQLVAR